MCDIHLENPGVGDCVDILTYHGCVGGCVDILTYRGCVGDCVDISTYHECSPSKRVRRKAGKAERRLRKAERIREVKEINLKGEEKKKKNRTYQW